jgi:uncharacterized protein YfaS (alpha-2-macroglobulin family)
MRLGKRILYLFLCLVAFLVVVGIKGCSTADISPGTAPLPTVAALPNPTLPDWIEQISPLGEADTKAQIRVRFKESLIPVESLESQNQQDLLKKFELVPPLPGQFRFLTPRMVGFQADRAIPKATRVQVTLKAGLADLKNHRLEKDLAWTFNTEPIKLSNLPSSYSGSGPPVLDNPIDLRPALTFLSNLELDTASLQKQTTLKPEGKNEPVSLKVALKDKPKYEATSPEEQFDRAETSWIYTLEPQKNLDKGTRYSLEFAPGLRPANGNLVSENAFTSQVATYSPLEFQRLTYYGQPDAGGAYGRFTQGIAQLQFNNGMDAESAIAHISINPAPANKDVPLVRAYEGDKLVNLNPWALAPDTSYTITVDKDLKDKFGQTLGKAVEVKYDTGDVSPDIWVPTDLHIFPTQRREELQLNIATVNLNSYKSAFAVVQPTDLVYYDSAYPRDNSGLLPDPSQWDSNRVTIQKNQSVETTVPLQKQLGGATGMLAYGVQARANSYQENNQKRWREPTFYGMVQLTNLGVFAQWFPQSGLVRVHHLSDGSAVANATVQIYQSQLEATSRPQPSPCATGKTDRTGMLSLNQRQFQACLTSGNETAPKLLVIAQEGRDWAFTRTNEWSGAYDYGVDAGWEPGKPVSRGTIFSDRQLYQPGENAAFTGVAYYLQSGVLRQDRNARYSVTLQGPNGQEQDLGTQTTNEFGTFALELPLEKTQALGTYTIRAQGSNDNQINGEFQVAEFKPPNFKVELNLEGAGEATPQPIVTANHSLEAKVQSNYLFGPPVQGGKVNYYVTRQRTEFTPQGWDAFVFGRRWFWPEEAPDVTSDVLQTSQVLNNDGQGSQKVSVLDLPYPMTYRVDAQVADVSNLTVADSQTFLALPGDRLIGLQTDFVATAGKEFPVQVIVTEPSGKAVLNQRVRLELQQMNYSRATRVVEGSRTQQNQVEYKTVATADVQSDVQAKSVNLTPPTSGSYRIRATLAGQQGESMATEQQIWVTGNEAAIWGDRYRNNRLELQLDKKSYRPGETATALIQSPYPDAELYFAVVRHKTIYQTVQKVKGAAPRIQFQVTPEMLPNAAVEAVLVRQGQPLNQVEPGSLDNLVRIGFAPFQVNLDDRYLKVEITPTVGAEGTPAAEPGTDQTLQLAVRNERGEPVQGQVSLMVVNEAVLQLTGYRPPDLVKTIYAEQPISTRLSDNRPDVVVQALTNPLQKGWGYGGGLSAGAANTRTRTDFKPLAYFNGAIRTDNLGQAKVNFKLPDDLTTWRVMAVAMSGSQGVRSQESGEGTQSPIPNPQSPDWQFGNGDNTFVVSKPLATNPILPQFARPGDRFQVGVSVSNNTGQAGDLAVNGSVTTPLRFDNSSGNQQTRIESGVSAYRFPVVVDQPGTAEVKFTSQLGSASDAFEFPLEVRSLQVTEQVVETGATKDQATIPLNVDKNVASDVGGLDISLASSLIPQLTAPAKQVLQEQDLPFLEPAASQLAIAANLQSLSQTYGQTFSGFNPQQQATQAFARLQTLQHPDGGFAAYPKQDRSDPFVTPYAAQAIAQANRAFGKGIETPNLAALQTYLGKLLADPGQYDYCKQALCKSQVRLEALLALAELGDRRNDFLAEIYGQRNNLDLVQQLKLARYLSQFPDWQQESRNLTNQLQEVIYQTGRSARVNLPEGWRWFGSQTAAQAQALRLLITQDSPPDSLDRLVQGLLNQRREGTWQNTYDNAEALTALVAYSRLQPTPPSFTATADLAGKTLATAQFEGYRNPSQEVQVAMADLPHDRNTLTLKKSGAGILHYLVAYRYRLQGNQPGRLNGLRVTRTIRPANEEKVLYRTGLFAPDPLSLPVGQVYDVGLEIITDHPVDHVVITDPLPAGLEAVDNSFQTTTPYFQAQGDSWQLSYQTIYKDRVVAFGDKLNPGVYTLHYLVRSVTPGTFVYPGAEAHLQYTPEEFGRSASTMLTVAEK